jgi:serine/threonine-protein kinase HipA
VGEAQPAVVEKWVRHGQVCRRAAPSHTPSHVHPRHEFDAPFHAAASVFGAIGDSAPDRWGRVLMRRFEASKAIEQNRAPRSLFEIDYLLGVNDEARQGALRFSVAPDENVFLSPKQKTSIPPLVDLPKLLLATERFIADNESSEDLRLLLAPGSSLDDHPIQAL